MAKLGIEKGVAHGKTETILGNSFKEGSNSRHGCGDIKGLYRTVGANEMPVRLLHVQQKPLLPSPYPRTGKDAEDT